MSQLLQRGARRPFDWVLFGVVLVLATIGILSLYSASNSDGSSHYARQILWFLLGGVGAGIIALQDYRVIARLAYPMLIIGIILLLLVTVAGTSINGSKRWLALGGFSVQPSEFLKLAVVVVTARYFSDHERPEGRGIVDLLVPVGMISIPFIQILTQPDLGTSLTLWLIFGTMAAFDRLKPTLTLSLIMVVIISIPLMWGFVLKEYQKDRVRAFMDPEAELQGDAWQVRQSRIAIGSGGAVGKGWLQGTQVQGGFVPYDESDFIFTHTGEQFGFVGSTVLMGLYIALLLWALQIARNARDRFGVLCAVGIAALYFWHITINIAMNMGMLPVVGLWLPFLSHGGTSVLVCMFAAGILMSISMRRTPTATAMPRNWLG